MTSKPTYLFLALALLTSRSVTAQTDTVLAETLFQQGRALLQEGKVSEACPKLAESHRLDPATGTLVALALCHEQEGKLASAWAEFNDAEGRSRQEGRQDREALAKERAAALLPRLSSLTVDVSPEAAGIAGLEIRVDGNPLARPAWGVAVPTNGGEHRIEATAPGKTPWSQSLTLANERDLKRVSVPALAAAGATPVVPVVTPKPVQPVEPAKPTPDSTPPKDDGSRPWGTMEWTGVAVGSAGVIALAAGGIFLASALDSKSNADCDADNVCESADDVQATSDAVSRANTATIFGIAGAVLAGTGVTLFVVGRSNARSSARAPTASVAVGPQGAELRLNGSF
jgi:serine/threonine-protein kinase